MFANIGFAEMKLIEDKVLGPSSLSHYYRVTTFCIDGYKFVNIGSTKGNDTMVQFYESGNNRPTKC